VSGQRRTQDGAGAMRQNLLVFRRGSRAAHTSADDIPQAFSRIGRGLRDFDIDLVVVEPVDLD
jgi:hypothetical protein